MNDLKNKKLNYDSTKDFLVEDIRELDNSTFQISGRFLNKQGAPIDSGGSFVIVSELSKAEILTALRE